MKPMRHALQGFLKNESGATAIEYGLIVAMIALAIVAGGGQVGQTLNYLFGDNNSRLQQALGTTP